MNSIQLKQGNSKNTFIWSILLFVCSCLLMLFFSLPSVAAADVASGTCGTNVNWSLSADGTLTISGKGDMKSYNNNTKKDDFRAYIDQIKTVIIENGVTSVGDYAFSKSFVLEEQNLFTMFISNISTYKPFKNLEKVSLPKSIKVIGISAFEGCPALKSIVIPGSVEVIKDSAFSQCKALETVTIEQGVTEIKGYAFSRSGIKEIKIPGTVKRLGQAAFESCESLSSVTLGNGLSEVSALVFYNCESLRGDIVFPKSVAKIGGGTIVGSPELNSITILNKNCELADGCFRNLPGDSEKYSGTIQGFPGSTAETYASKCHSRFIALDPSSEAGQEETEEHIHNFGSVVVERKASCNQTGLQYQVCSICGKRGNEKKIAKTAHSYQKKTTAATMKKAGKTYGVCSVCKDVKKYSTIAKIALVKLSKTSCVYDGTMQTPKLIIKDANDSSLKKDKDYTVQYSNGRFNCGRYTVKVVFKGNYSGKKTLSYQIVPEKVTGLKQNAGKGICFSWNAVGCATVYDVEYYDEREDAFLPLPSKKYPHGYTVTQAKGSLKRGTEMQARVRAVYITKDGERIAGKYSEVIKMIAK